KGKGPGGPWIDISPEDISLTTTTFTDTGIVGYEGWYYTLAYRKTVDGVTYTGPVSEPVFFRRGHRLDVTVVSGFFQNGMSGLTDGSPYQGNSALGPAAMFDGNTSTFADIVPEAVRVGVDLAGSYGISFARVFPRSNIVSRPDGSALWGSNNTDDWTVGEQISPAIPITAADWVTVTVNSPELWRYVYLYKASNFYANVAELELYGWTLADLADELIAPRNLAATCSAEALTLTWDPALNAEWYLVERKVGQSGAWVRIAEDLTECRFNDVSVNYRGVLHAYRVVAVRGDEQACSATLELIPYVTGNGTGLYATYYSNASLAYTPDETVAGTRVDPTIDFGWGSGGPLADLTDHFIATWTGKLIIPLPGIYTFTLETDDGATFRLDGEYLYNNMSAVGTRTFYRELTAGEHDIRIDYYEISGQAYCHLAWDGPVGKGPIPTSQLVPVPPEPLPEPWVGERTLGSQQWGYTRFNPDGSLTIAAAGMDFFSTNEGYHGIWQEATGNFCYTLRYQFDSADPGATKAMLQVRQSPFSGAAVIAPCVMLHTDDADSYYAYNLKYRAVEEGSIEDDAGGWVSGASDTGWLRVKRIGPVFSCYTRTEDDGPWTLRYTFEDTAEAFGETLYIGPAVSRSGTTALDSVTYSRFTLTPADPGVLVILR
ncbi:MAG: hypothetical protein J6334_10450, partial [Kiritimatiellae bacterium]|nr:hypothetical protein [Kiritimatiellia bacterium]